MSQAADLAPVGFDAWHLPAGVQPPSASLSFEAMPGVQVRALQAEPGWMEELAGALEGVRERLLALPVRSVAHALGLVGGRLLDPDDPLRARALALLPATSGLSAAMAEAVLDGMASDWTTERLMEMVVADFPDPDVLDRFISAKNGRVRAMGGGLCVQIVSGSVPGVATTALMRSLLTKTPTLIKPGRGDVVLPVLFARALAEVDPVLGDALAVVYWTGGRADVEDAALSAASVVTVYGGNDAVRSVRERTPITVRFVPYHHRVSLGILGREALDPTRVHRVASEVAGSVSFFDQRGCVSPHVIYVEDDGRGGAADFAKALTVALGTVEDHLPGGGLEPEEASHLHQARGSAELRSAAGEGVIVSHGGEATWTVIYDPDPTFESSCTGRLVRLKPVADVFDVPRLVASIGPHLQTVGVAGCGDRVEGLAEALARVGVLRIAGFVDVPFPPPWWHHDGDGPLRSLVRWVDLEG